MFDISLNIFVMVEGNFEIWYPRINLNERNHWIFFWNSLTIVEENFEFCSQKSTEESKTYWYFSKIPLPTTVEENNKFWFHNIPGMRNTFWYFSESLHLVWRKFWILIEEITQNAREKLRFTWIPSQCLNNIMNLMSWNYRE